MSSIEWTLFNYYQHILTYLIIFYIFVQIELLILHDTECHTTVYSILCGFTGIIPVIRLNRDRNGLDTHCLTSVYIEFCIYELFIILDFSKFSTYAYMSGTSFDILKFPVFMPGLFNKYTANGI